MPKSVAALTCTLGIGLSILSTIALPQPAQAQKASCQLDPGCVYGPEVSDRWIKGNRLEAAGNFKGAIAEYQKAVDAAVNRQLPRVDKDKQILFRLCAISGSMARLEGAKQGAAFMDSHMMTTQNLEMAKQVSRDRFTEFLNEQDAETPEFPSNRCP